MISVSRISVLDVLTPKFEQHRHTTASLLVARSEQQGKMNSTTTSLAPVFAFLEYTLSTAQTTFDKLPGSAVIQRYVKSSHQNDPGRTLLELILFLFAIRTLLQSRTRADRTGKHFIQFSDKVRAFHSFSSIVKMPNVH